MSAAKVAPAVGDVVTVDKSRRRYEIVAIVSGLLFTEFADFKPATFQNVNLAVLAGSTERYRRGKRRGRGRRVAVSRLTLAKGSRS